MNDCTNTQVFNPGALVRIPVPVQAPFNATIFALVKRVIGRDVQLDVTVDPVCKLNPELFSSPEITVPAMLLA